MPTPVYILRIYGLPPGPDEEHEGLQSALDKATRELKIRQRPAFAEIRQKSDSLVVWSAYLSQDGSVVEYYEREPGAD